MFYIFKVTGVLVRQILVCPALKISDDHLQITGGPLFKKLQAENKLLEIKPELIIERFYNYAAITDDVARSRYYTIEFNNIDLLTK